MTLYVQTTNALLEKILQEAIETNRLLREIQQHREENCFGHNAHTLLAQIANK